MKRLYQILVCCMVWFIIPSGLCLAQPSRVMRSASVTTIDASAKAITQSDLVSSVEVTPDGFGGNFYAYRDQWGNKHITNNADCLPEQLRPVESGGLYRRDEGSDHDTDVNPLVICEARPSEITGPYAFDQAEEIEVEKTISDPIEPLNRAFFKFNDRLYFWILKPVSKGYKQIMPLDMRVGVRNFFSNITMPIRAVNCILQGKIKGFGIEILRFVLNTAVGGLGFGDPAKDDFNLSKQDEDFGQTLGFYGLGHGMYIDWPFLGPSSLRGTVGLGGDIFLDPVYQFVDWEYALGIKGYAAINKTSLILGDYESLKESSVDPYVALRNAYFQHRQYKIDE